MREVFPVKIVSKYNTLVLNDIFTMTDYLVYFQDIQTNKLFSFLVFKLHILE